MDVDKLIKFPIYNIFDTTEPLIGEKVLFSNLMKDFSNIEKLKSGILIKVDDKNIYPFCIQTDNGFEWCHFFTIFVAKPEYREFTAKEFLKKFKLGDVIYLKNKRFECEPVGIFTGYNVCKDGYTTLDIGCHTYSMNELLSNFEIKVNGEFVPFGIHL